MKDKFTDPSTGVLFNKLDITDKAELAAKEGSYSVPRMVELLTGAHEIPGRYDAAHLRAINRHIFQDVYPWAGQTRAEAEFQGQKPTYASGVPAGTVMRYAPYQQLDERLNAIGAQLAQENYLRGLSAEQFAGRAAYYFDQYNYVHAFREGNGRTLQAAFQQLGREAGYEVNFQRANIGAALNEARDTAIVRPHGPEQPERNLARLTQLLRESITSLDEPGAERLRDPAQARPLATPTPAMQGYEALRVLQDSAIPISEALRDIDRGHTARANQFREQVQAVLLQPDKLPTVAPAIRAVAQEVAAHPQMRREADLMQHVQRLRSSVVQLQTLVESGKPEPTHTASTGPTAQQRFVQQARQLAEGLDEHGYPGPASGLNQAAKAVERQPHLGGATLDAVRRALEVAERIPDLQIAAAETRQSGRELQQQQIITKSEQHISSRSFQHEEPER